MDFLKIFYFVNICTHYIIVKNKAKILIKILKNVNIEIRLKNTALVEEYFYNFISDFIL